MKDLCIYSAPGCQNCKTLKDFLTSKGLKYREIDTSTVEGLSEMRAEIPGQRQLPVLQVDGLIVFSAKSLIDRDSIRPGPWLHVAGIEG